MSNYYVHIAIGEYLKNNKVRPLALQALKLNEHQYKTFVDCTNALQMVSMDKKVVKKKVVKKKRG